MNLPGFCPSIVSTSPGGKQTLGEGVVTAQVCLIPEETHLPLPTPPWTPRPAYLILAHRSHSLPIRSYRPGSCSPSEKTVHVSVA